MAKKPDLFFTLDFECVECPPCAGIFTCRVTEAEKSMLSERHMPYRCPRGHKQTWSSYRGFWPVDDAGYTIDRTHPDYAKMMDALDREYLGKVS